jgi:hypothetical protein
MVELRPSVARWIQPENFPQPRKARSYQPYDGPGWTDKVKWDGYRDRIEKSANPAADTLDRMFWTHHQSPQTVLSQRTRTFVSAVVTVSMVISAQGQTLHDAVREENDAGTTGTISVTINGMSPTRDLATILSESDLVVEGILERSEVRLTRDERSIETVFDVGVIQVLSQNVVSTPSPRAPIKQLKVLQPGGQAVVDGRTVFVWISDFPIFQVGPPSRPISQAASR